VITKECKKYATINKRTAYIIKDAFLLCILLDTFIGGYFIFKYISLNILVPKNAFREIKQSISLWYVHLNHFTDFMFVWIPFLMTSCTVIDFCLGSFFQFCHRQMPPSTAKVSCQMHNNRSIDCGFTVPSTFPHLFAHFLHESPPHISHFLPAFNLLSTQKKQQQLLERRRHWFTVG